MLLAEFEYNDHVIASIIICIYTEYQMTGTAGNPPVLHALTPRQLMNRRQANTNPHIYVCMCTDRTPAYSPPFIQLIRFKELLLVHRLNSPSVETVYITAIVPAIACRTTTATEHNYPFPPPPLRIPCTAGQSRALDTHVNESIFHQIYQLPRDWANPQVANRAPSNAL